MGFFTGAFKPGSILRVDEHHETYYYDVSSITKMREVCLSLLKEKYRDGYYDADDRPDPFVFGINECDIKIMPKNTRARDTLLVEYNVYQKEMLDYNASIELVKKVKSILKNKDGEKARIVIEDRSDKGNTDERISLIHLTKP